MKLARGEKRVGGAQGTCSGTEGVHGGNWVCSRERQRRSGRGRHERGGRARWLALPATSLAVCARRVSLVSQLLPGLVRSRARLDYVACILLHPSAIRREPALNTLSSRPSPPLAAAPDNVADALKSRPHTSLSGSTALPLLSPKLAVLRCLFVPLAGPCSTSPSSSGPSNAGAPRRLRLTRSRWSLAHAATLSSPAPLGTRSSPGLGTSRGGRGALVASLACAAAAGAGVTERRLPAVDWNGGTGAAGGTSDRAERCGRERRRAGGATRTRGRGAAGGGMRRKEETGRW